MVFGQIKTESYLDGTLAELRGLVKTSPEFEKVKQEAIREIEDLLSRLMGMVDVELSEDDRTPGLLEKVAEVAGFLEQAELLERIGNLQEIYE